MNGGAKKYNIKYNGYIIVPGNVYAGTNTNKGLYQGYLVLSYTN